MAGFIIGGVIFSAVVFMAVTAVPLPDKNKKLKAVCAAAAAILYTAAVCCILSFSERAAEEILQFSPDISMCGKKISDWIDSIQFLPHWLTVPVGWVTSLFATLAYYVSKLPQAVSDAFSADGGIITFGISSAVSGAVFSAIYAVKHISVRDKNEDIGIGKAVGVIAMDKIGECWLLAPVCAFAAAAVIYLIGSEYAYGIGFVLYILSYIPIIGVIAGGVLSLLLCIASGHFLTGILSAIIAVGSNIGLGALKNLTEALGESKESNNKE
ncbi:MAG: hypothetical protein IJ446_11095 [Oscillospiraceae bacterium]|nr:hypothetical protein [Oscillospiraceae bacterium]